MKDLIQRARTATHSPDNGNLIHELADALERLTAGDVALPEPDLYAHELLANGGGVWLGVLEKGICEKAHDEGETGAEVREYHLTATLVDYGNHRAAAAVLAERERIAAWYLKDTAHLPEDELAAAIRKGTP